MSNTFSKTKMESHTGRHPASFCGGAEKQMVKRQQEDNRDGRTHTWRTQTGTLVLRKKALGRQPEASKGQCPEVI